MDDIRISLGVEETHPVFKGMDVDAALESGLIGSSHWRLSHWFINVTPQTEHGRVWVNEHFKRHVTPEEVELTRLGADPPDLPAAPEQESIREAYLVTRDPALDLPVTQIPAIIEAATRDGLTVTIVDEWGRAV
jgi:hypothetical protein